MWNTDVCAIDWDVQFVFEKIAAANFNTLTASSQVVLLVTIDFAAPSCFNS